MFSGEILKGKLHFSSSVLTVYEGNTGDVKVYTELARVVRDGSQYSKVLPKINN